MKLQSHLKNYLLAVGILLCLTSYCDASAFLLAWDRDNPVLSPDTFYNDIESQNFHGTTNSPGVQAVMSARHYGEDPLSSTQWGLIDDSLPWNHSADGWIVRHGFSPDWKGSIYHTESGEAVEASYISIMVTKPVGATLTNLQLHMLDVDESLDVSTDHSWAITSIDGFDQTYSETYNASIAPKNIITPFTVRGLDGLRIAIWDFSDLSYSGDDPFEIRMYGITGQDEGNWAFTSVTGIIPEPKTAALIATSLLLIFRRKKNNHP